MQDQKQWAPLLYFVHSVAGTVVGMMHKLGMFKLRINYGVKMISDYLYGFELTSLRCFINDGDEANASRYYESFQCRMVAETVLRSTFNSMMLHEDLDAAVMHTMQSITYNAMDLSLLPVLHERFIQRIVQLEPLMGVSALGLMLGVPVVSMRSVLQLMNGKPVTDRDDAMAMRQFISRCVAACDLHYLQQLGGGDNQQQGSLSSNCAHMLRYVGVDEQSNPTGKLQGYITCAQLKEVCAPSAASQQQFANNGGGGRGGGGHHQQHNQESSSSSSMFGSISPNGVPMIPINSVCRRIYSTRQKTLANCAFIRDFLGFQRCVLSLMKAYDVREFFGGMSCYHDGEAMARALGVPNPERFSNRFMEDSLDGSKADPVMLPSKVTQPNGEVEYCIGVRVWDLLLWFAAIGRPRLDVGILTDFSKTLAR